MAWNRSAGQHQRAPLDSTAPTPMGVILGWFGRIPRIGGVIDVSKLMQTHLSLFFSPPPPRQVARSLRMWAKPVKKRLCGQIMAEGGVKGRASRRAIQSVVPYMRGGESRPVWWSSNLETPPKQSDAASGAAKESVPTSANQLQTRPLKA